MSLKALDAYLSRIEKRYYHKAEKAGDNDRIDVNDAQLSFAMLVGVVEGEVKRQTAGLKPRVSRTLIKECEDFFKETQNTTNWEDDGIWPYPTYDEQIYTSMGEFVGSLKGTVRKELETVARTE